MHDDDVTAERWFRAVGAAHDQAPEDGDLSAFRSALAESALTHGLDQGAVEQFVGYLESQPDPMDIVAAMAGHDPAELLAAYQQWIAGAAASDGAEDAATEDVAEDPAAWNAYLVENGGHWDGSEQSWPDFRAWFLYHAQEAGVGGSAEAFLSYAESATEPVAVFREYGVELSATEQPVEAEEVGAGQAESLSVEEAVDEVAVGVIAGRRARRGAGAADADAYP